MWLFEHTIWSSDFPSDENSSVWTSLMIVNSHGFEVHKCNESELQVPSEVPSWRGSGRGEVRFFSGKFEVLFDCWKTMSFWLNFQACMKSVSEFPRLLWKQLKKVTKKVNVTTCWANWSHGENVNSLEKNKLQRMTFFFQNWIKLSFTWHSVL